MIFPRSRTCKAIKVTEVDVSIISISKNADMLTFGHKSNKIKMSKNWYIFLPFRSIDYNIESIQVSKSISIIHEEILISKD